MKKYIVSVSGGKDSTALYLWAIDQFGKDGFRAVMADTGHEHPITIDYAKKLHLVSGGPKVEIVKADFTDRLAKKGKTPSGNAMKDLCVWKGRVPSSKAQFCTEHIKLKPIKDWLESWRTDDMEVIMLTGIRAGESERRSKMPEREWSDYYDCEQWRPLLRWTEEQVFEQIKKAGLVPNPLYEMGYARVGCFPCIHARKIELSRLPEWAWDRIEDIEKAVGRSWFSTGTVPLKPEVEASLNELYRKVRFDKKPCDEHGEDCSDNWEPIKNQDWFNYIEFKNTYSVPTIQDAKEWAMTSRGGRQFNMFQEDEKDPPSCMSAWGACE